MLRFIAIAAILSISSLSAAFAQKTDTSKVIDLNEVIIKHEQALGGVEQMPQVKDNVIYAGKKSTVIHMDRINADLSTINSD